MPFQELAKLLEDQHGYIDLQNIPEHKYYSMDKNPDEDEKLWESKQSVILAVCDIKHILTLIEQSVKILFFQKREKIGVKL